MLFKFILLFFILINFSYAETIKSKSGAFYLEQAEFSELHNWEKDSIYLALKAFVNSCNQMNKMNKNSVLSSELYKIKVKDLLDICEVASNTSEEDAKLFFQNWFVPFLVVDKKNEENGLFTGYYQSSIKASRNKDNTYRFPIYRKPSDLKTNEEYYTRQEIDEGALEGQGLEIFYTDSKVDLLFLQIQGSGKVFLDDGTITKVAFAGKNNRPYKSVGSILIEKKYMKKQNINAISIKEWLNNNPDKIDEVLHENESYIFFKEQKDNYVRGAHGSILTPYRSIAIDSSLMPYGFPFWIETQIKNNDKTISNFKRLVISQDTGSAIKGAVRADIFFGDDEKAEFLASNMNFSGKYYILLPKNIADLLHSKY